MINFKSLNFSASFFLAFDIVVINFKTLDFTAGFFLVFDIVVIHFKSLDFSANFFRGCDIVVINFKSLEFLAGTVKVGHIISNLINTIMGGIIFFGAFNSDTEAQNASSLYHPYGGGSLEAAAFLMSLLCGTCSSRDFLDPIKTVFSR